MFSFIGWIIIGLIAGMLARLLMPGRQPMGWLLTIGLGLAGSLLGGFISSAIFGPYPDDPGVQTAGLLMSTVGAVIVLWAYLAFARRNTRAV